MNNFTSVMVSNTLPTAHITVNKDRLKIYPIGQSDTLYMNNGQEFEFEFFNPRQHNILAVIHINGEKISDTGLIIKPGQRVYLERYIDTSKKFKFETYEIANDEISKFAALKNGNISIFFYDEDFSSKNKLEYTITTNWRTPQYFNANNLLNVSNSTCYYNQTNDVLSSYSSVSSKTINPILNINKKETGRVEQGSNSDQKLIESTHEFKRSSFHSIEYSILPISQRNLEINDIRLYCPECKYRIRKQTWKFCPKCGEQL